MNLEALCIYCGSRPGARAHFRETANKMGELLAGEGIDVIYGGSSRGMMGAVADSALGAGGKVVGILPGGLASREKAHRQVSKLHVVDSMHERKALMAKLSDGFIALPGGLGTLEELCEVTTWAQLGIHQKPVGICNAAGYFDGFLAFIDHAVQMEFLTEEHRRLLIVDEDPEVLLDKMRGFEPFLERVWLDESEI